MAAGAAAAYGIYKMKRGRRQMLARQSVRQLASAVEQIKHIATSPAGHNLHTGTRARNIWKGHFWKKDMYASTLLENCIEKYNKKNPADTRIDIHNVQLSDPQKMNILDGSGNINPETLGVDIGGVAGRIEKYNRRMNEFYQGVNGQDAEQYHSPAHWDAASVDDLGHLIEFCEAELMRTNSSTIMHDQLTNEAQGGLEDSIKPSPSYSEHRSIKTVAI